MRNCGRAGATEVENPGYFDLASRWSPQLDYIGGVAEFYGGGIKFSCTEFLQEFSGIFFDEFAFAG